MRRVALTILTGIAILTFAATPSRAASITYEYTGGLFNFCGFGCPENAPTDPRDEDFLSATFTFSDVLAPNLTFADDLSALLVGWTITNHIGGIDFSSANGDTLGDATFPFRLATDGAGNIVGWQVYARSTLSEAAFANPSILGCEPPDCDPAIYFTDFVAVNLFSSEGEEWDAGRGSEDPNAVSGSFGVQQVPEPTVLTLAGLGMAGAWIRRRRSRRS